MVSGADDITFLAYLYLVPSRDTIPSPELEAGFRPRPFPILTSLTAHGDSQI